MINQVFENSWYINLDFRRDRMEESIKEFSSVGIDANRFPAIYQEGKKRQGRTAGCTKSHIALLRQFLESDHDMIAVFEDDISFHPNFVELIDPVISVLNREEWSLFFLYGMEIGTGGITPLGENKDSLISFVSLGYLPTHAYLAKRNAAQTLIDLAVSGVEDVVPIDKAWKMAYKLLPVFTSTQTLAIQRDSFSDIGRDWPVVTKSW